MSRITARGRSSAYLLAAASVTALAAAAPAFAQDTADVGEVVVTASRIQSAGFTAPTPTTVLAPAELTRRAPVTIQESINEVPSFRPTTTSQNTSTTTSGTNGNAGAATVDLRGLGGARTLTLINGRRTGGSNDLNQFPVILTQRIDIVTGGASAAYGSDAVAGVVNIVLDRKFEGLKGELQAGQSKYGDGKNWKGSLAAGGGLFGDRLHWTLGGEYSYYEGVDTSEPRPWILANRQLQIANPCPINVPLNTLPATCGGQNNGLPAFIVDDNENFSTLAPGGIITAGPLKGITFEDGGVPRQFQYGTVLGQYMLGGERSDFSIFNINANLKRYNWFSHTDFRVNDSLNLWVEVSNAQNKGRTLTSRPRDQGTITIQRDNPFVPAVIRSEMVRLNLATLTMGRLNNDGGQPVSTNTNDIWRWAGGVEGQFGALGKNWTWDAYYQFGRLHSFVKTVGSRNNRRWTQALDAVTGPNGTPVCRDPAGGCVPFNIFGPNAASQSARDFVFGTQTSNSTNEQTAAAFNVNGEPLSTWAGPVALAFGAEYRKQTLDTYGDALAQLSIWDSGNTKRLAGKFDLYEGYAEVAVPLAKDYALAKSLDLNGAVRRTHYSTGGGYWVTTWKVGATWEPTSEILFRGTISRDIRAPSINELFNAGAVANNNAINFQGPFAGQGVIAALTTVGNPNLRPERSKTYTAGFTYRPRWARLRFSADYYDINIKDQIGTIGANAIVDRCRVGDPDFCRRITFDSVGTITAVLNETVNSNSFQTRGIDLEASFTQPLNELIGSLPGTVTARALATKYLEYAITDAVLGRTDRSGQNMATFIGTTNVPRWMANYIVSYNVGPFNGGVQFRYISPGALEKTSITGTATERLNNKVGSQTVVNLNAQYVVQQRADGRRIELFGAVNNLFNRGPSYPIWGLSNLGIYYDSVGMVYRGGVRFTY